MGGKTTGTQLKYLIKILKQSEDKTPLVDFYTNCNIPFPKELLRSLPNRSTLIRGLEFLQSVKEYGKSVLDFKVIIGENDIFLDSIKLKELIPQIEIVPGAGHEPSQLLDRLASTIFIK